MCYFEIPQENNTLPLNKNIKHIAVLGPNADNANTQLGNYNGKPSVVTTVLQGIKDKLKNADVFYSRATDFVSTEPQDFSKLIDSIKRCRCNYLCWRNITKA